MTQKREPDPVLEAEQSALGCALLSPAAIGDVFAIITPDDFFRPAHQLIAETITAMHAAGKPVDPVTVADELAKRSKLGKVGGPPYLHTLFARPVSAANGIYYAQIVREQASRRRLREIADVIRQEVALDISPAEIATRAQKNLDSLSRTGPATERTTIPGIPGYPVNALCGPLADLVSSTILPAALVAGAGLGALAGVCGNADLKMPDDALVRPTLWLALVAPRGSGKTPSMDKAFSRLRELDAATHEQFRMGAGNDTTVRIDDATLETVARFLDNGDGTGVVEADELSGFLQSIGQYKRVSGDKSRWLALWSAQPWRYQRVGGDRSGGVGIDIYVSRPVVSIVGGIQPHLQHLLGDADSGFRPRWLIHCAPLETITWGPGIHAASEWEKAIENLYCKRSRRTWQLKGEAFGIWREQCATWKAQARGSENTSTSAALDKSDIQCARIALVIAESMNPGNGGEIPAEAMRCAIAITDYVMNCWRAMPNQESFALSKRDEILSRHVDELAGWLDTRKQRKATRTEVKEAHVAGVRTADEMNTLLDAYAKVYPGSVVTEKPSGGGRPGQVVYAPIRQSPPVTESIPLHSGGVSDRSETPGVGEGRSADVNTQVTEFTGVSGQVVGNSWSETPWSETQSPQVTT